MHFLTRRQASSPFATCVRVAFFFALALYVLHTEFVRVEQSVYVRDARLLARQDVFTGPMNWSAVEGGARRAGEADAASSPPPPPPTPPSPSPPSPPPATVFSTLNEQGGTDFPSRRCQHHLCNGHVVPDAAQYGCDPNPPGGREWKLSLLPGGMFPANEGAEKENDYDYIVGHKALMRSARDGMRKLGAAAGAWNYHPSHTDMLGDVIWMPTCNYPGYMRADKWLHERARRRQDAHIRGFYICGPHGLTMQNMSWATEELMGFLIAPSPWVAMNSITSEPPNTRVRILAAGVDTEQMKPTGWVDGVSNRTTHAPQRKAVLYVKRAAPAAMRAVQTALQADNYQTIVISYGAYTYASFRAALDGAAVAFWFCNSESQGLALVEAWSMNVPTFVYSSDVAMNTVAYEITYPDASPAPYVNYKTGLIFRDYAKIKPVLARMDRYNFEPRKYVLNTMSDEISALNTLRAVQCEWERRKKHVWV